MVVVAMRLRRRRRRLSFETLQLETKMGSQWPTLDGGICFSLFLPFFRRTSCFYHFNTSEGGPCVMRPMAPNSWDAPNPKDLTNANCVEDWRAGGLEGWDGQDFTGKCRINKAFPGCKDAYCGKTKDGHRVLLGAGQIKQLQKVEGPWAEHQESRKERMARHAQSWNNEFGQNPLLQ